MNLTEWSNSVLGRIIGDAYGTQSPAVVNDYCQRVLNDSGFSGNSYELQPKSNHWVRIDVDQLKPGDIAIVPRDHTKQFGDSIVITTVTTVQVIGLGAKVNKEYVGWTNYRFKDISHGFRYQVDGNNNG